MRVYFAPGWRGGDRQVRPWIDGLATRGFEAVPVVLPPARAERAAARFTELATPVDVVGGTSFGGRAAGLAAVEVQVAGLLCIAFPLGGDGERRTARWPLVACPALVVNGTEDPLAPVAELAAAVATLPAGRLELVEGGGHDLRPRLDEVLDRAAAFLATL